MFAVCEQITSAVLDIRQDMKARRDLEARALGEDSSRTSLVLSSLDLKMQEMQAHQAEMQRRQAEEAVRLQAERKRLDIQQESMAQERKCAARELSLRRIAHRNADSDSVPQARAGHVQHGAA